MLVWTSRTSVLAGRKCPPGHCRLSSSSLQAPDIDLWWGPEGAPTLAGLTLLLLITASPSPALSQGNVKGISALSGAETPGCSLAWSASRHPESTATTHPGMSYSGGLAFQGSLRQCAWPWEVAQMTLDCVHSLCNPGLLLRFKDTCWEPRL